MSRLPFKTFPIMERMFMEDPVIHYLEFIGQSRLILVLHRLRPSGLQMVGFPIRITDMIGRLGVMA